MGRVIVDMSPSVDGFIAGSGVSPAAPFGDAGHRLHRWLGLEGITPAPADLSAAQGMFATAGAVVIGRRMFDVGIDRWGEGGAFGLPTFVVTHRGGEPLVRGRTTFRFVTAGARRALEDARGAAGDRDIVVAGGADIARQLMAFGLVDELRLHVVPVLLGHGTALFDAGSRAELEPLWVEASPNATHVTYRVLLP
jgi:dihydrofolate reductase